MPTILDYAKQAGVRVQRLLDFLEHSGHQGISLEMELPDEILGLLESQFPARTTGAPGSDSSTLQDLFTTALGSTESPEDPESSDDQENLSQPTEEEQTPEEPPDRDATLALGTDLSDEEMEASEPRDDAVIPEQQTPEELEISHLLSSLGTVKPEEQAPEDSAQSESVETEAAPESLEETPSEEPPVEPEPEGDSDTGETIDLEAFLQQLDATEGTTSETEATASSVEPESDEEKQDETMELEELLKSLGQETKQEASPAEKQAQEPAAVSKASSVTPAEKPVAAKTPAHEPAEEDKPSEKPTRRRRLPKPVETVLAIALNGLALLKDVWHEISVSLNLWQKAVLLGLVLTTVGIVTGAITKHFMDYAPGVEQHLLQQADSHAMEGDKQKAADAYMQIIKRYPNSAQAEEAWLNLANLYFDEQRYSQAMDAYSNVLRLQSRRTLTADGLADYPLGEVRLKAELRIPECLRLMERYQETEQALLALQERFPDGHTAEQISHDLLGLYFQWGTRENSMELLDHGIREGEKFLERFPDSKRSASTLETLGDLYLERGIRDRVTQTAFFVKSLDNYHKAQEFHRADILLPVAPASLLSKQADVRMALGQYQEAEILYQQVLSSAQLASGTADVTIKLGRALVRQGKYPESAKTLERQLENSVLTERQESHALYLLGDAYYESKRYDMMMDAYSKALRLEGFVPTDEDIDPMRAQMRITNYLYFAQGKYKEAIEQYEEILKKYPQGRYRFRTIYCLGQAYAAQNNLNEAARYFTMLIGENPELRYVDPAFLKDAYYKLGRIYFQKKDYPKAIKAYEALLDRYPGDVLSPLVLERQGDCYAQLALYAIADKVYRKVLDEFPESSNWSLTALKLGQLKENISEFVEAAEVYARIKRRDPNDPLGPEAEYRRLEMELRIARTELGVAAERRFASVLRDARQSQSEYPGEVRFHSQEGLAAYSLDDFPAAVSALLKYLDEAGDLEKIAHCTFLLGDALFRLGNYREAAETLQQRVQMEGTEDERAHALFLLALCEKRLDEFDKAVKTLDELLTSHPSSSFISEASAEKRRLEWSMRNVGYLQGASSSPQ